MRNQEFPIQTGVYQGDVTSPLLFNIVIDTIMRKAFKGRCGVQYGINNFLTDLTVTFFTDTDAEATNILYHIAPAYSPRINADKTKVMTTDGS